MTKSYKPPELTILKEGKGQYVVRDENETLYGPPASTLEAINEILNDWKHYYES